MYKFFIKNFILSLRKKVLKGDWKYGGWDSLAVSAGLDEKYFRQIYSWLCAYAHSSRWSVVQIQQMSGLDKQREMGSAFISILMITLGKYGFDYIEIMPRLKEKVDISSKEYQKILEYKTIAELLSAKAKQRTNR
jgi:hypothetical protein